MAKTAVLLVVSTYARSLGNWTTGSFPPPRPLRGLYYRSFYRTVVEAVGVRVAELRLLVRAFDALIMLATIDW